MYIGANSAAGTFAALVGTSLSVSDGNITNVGDIALDSISADGTDMDISLSDNSSTALEIKEGSTAYTLSTLQMVKPLWLERNFSFDGTATFDDEKKITFGGDGCTGDANSL